MKLLAILLFTLSIVGCGGGSSNSNNPVDTNENTSGNTTGILTLSGDDTTIVGTQLDTGYVGTSLAAELQPDYIAIVDQASSVTFTPPNLLTPNIADPNNGFVMVVMDDSPRSGIKGISMSIIVQGSKLDYACTTPVATFIECGTNSIALDIPNKIITFDNATVINTDTNTILTIDGSLTWSGNGNGGNGGGNGGTVTELEGTWSTTCLYDDYWGTYDTGSITFSGNTFSSFGVEYSDSACTVVDESYSSSGTFAIGNSMITSSGVSANEVDVTLLTMDGNNFTYTYYDIFRIDSDRLYFGDTDGEYDGNSVAKRPIDLDFSYPSTRD